MYLNIGCDRILPSVQSSMTDALGRQNIHLLLCLFILLDGLFLTGNSDFFLLTNVCLFYICLFFLFECIHAQQQILPNSHAVPTFLTWQIQALETTIVHPKTLEYSETFCCKLPSQCYSRQLSFHNGSCPAAYLIFILCLSSLLVLQSPFLGWT